MYYRNCMVKKKLGHPAKLIKPIYIYIYLNEKKKNSFKMRKKKKCRDNHIKGQVFRIHVLQYYHEEQVVLMVNYKPKSNQQIPMERYKVVVQFHQ